MKVKDITCHIKPLNTPNLPAYPVKTVIMANGYKKLSDTLQSLHIDVLYTSINKGLDRSVSNHADMLVYHGGDDLFLLSIEQEGLYQQLLKLKQKPNYVKPLIKSPYPNDAGLNAARVGNFLVCNTKTVAAEVFECAKKQNLIIIDVKQGYSKCSVCIINDRAIVTEDVGISRECEKKGIDVLVISKGSIKLTDHDYGFIGGCTGLIDKNKLAVTGNIKMHSDYKIISEFLCKYKIEVISLDDGELVDIGGILPVMQMK